MPDKTFHELLKAKVGGKLVEEWHRERKCCINVNATHIPTSKSLRLTVQKPKGSFYLVALTENVLTAARLLSDLFFVMLVHVHGALLSQFIPFI